MLKYILLSLLIPVMTYAQEDQLYLSAQNVLTTQKTDYRCTLDHERSKGYAKSYNAVDAQKKVVKELNTHVRVPASVKTEANKKYIYHHAQIGDYLIGDYQNGKPYNGFFKEYGSNLDWMIYSFYHNGKMLEQIYNDQYNTVTSRPDTEEAWTTLDAVNTFTNDVLTTGVRITPLKLEGGGAELVQTLKDGHTTHFILGLFAMHYGEFITVTPLPTGYLLQSSQSLYQVRLTFNSSGRRQEYLNNKNKVEDVVEYTQHPLDDFAKIDRKRSFTYLRKGNELFVEQANDAAQLARVARRAEGNEHSAFLAKITDHLYTQHPLNKVFFTEILKDAPVAMPDEYFGQYTFYEGKGYGAIYQKGTLPGTYSMDVYNADKLSTDKTYQIRNKALDEIVAIFKAIRSKEKH